MLVKDILESVTLRYNDSGYTRLTGAEYLKFLDDAISKLILVRPDAHVQTAIVGLSAGTRQEIPSDGYSLIDIYMNKESAGGGAYTNGAPILQVERKDLDYFSDWHTTTEVVTDIDEFAYDRRSPRTFWVSPPPATADSVYVEMDYSYGVDSYADLTDDFEDVLDMDIPIEDIFRSALIAYMLYLCFSTDSSSLNDMTIAAQYEQTFYTGLGLEYQASLLVQPKIKVEVQQ
jgi:hypothetical protein